jgi:hypothetical protein
MWHALAKLRMHTDSSLALLDEVTTGLGYALRHLATTVSSNFPTCETPAEYAKCQRTSSTSTTQGRQPKGLNLCTIKLHSLGDYVSTIKRYGTTENYSTGSVSQRPPIYITQILTRGRVSLHTPGPRPGMTVTQTRGMSQNS